MAVAVAVMIVAMMVAMTVVAVMIVSRALVPARAVAMVVVAMVVVPALHLHAEVLAELAGVAVLAVTDRFMRGGMRPIPGCCRAPHRQQSRKKEREGFFQEDLLG
jgi:hypothetical protein